MSIARQFVLLIGIVAIFTHAAMVKALCSISLGDIGTQTANSLGAFMDDAQRDAILINWGQQDVSDDISTRFYVGGYAMGFTVEQIITLKVGAVAASASGTEAKALLATTKAGRATLAGANAVKVAVAGFKAQAIARAAKLVTDNVVTKTFVESTRVMVDRVTALEVTYNGKTVGQTLGEVVQQADKSLTGFYDELRLIGKPLDDFGVKAHEKLARLLEVDIGSALTEAEMRGFVRVYARLEFGAGDFYDKLPLVFRTEAAAGKQRLRTALAAYADPASVPDKDLLTLVYVAKKEVDSAEHPALVAFKQRAEELAPEVGQPLRNYEGIAAARYEIQTGHTGLYRPTASDIPDAGLRARVDYVDPATPGNYIDVKGPILTSAGEFDETVTTARIEGLADSAVQKAQINNGLVPSSAGGLNPPLPTTVVVDLFGLTEAEASVVKTRIQNSGVAESYFIILEN